MKTWWRRVLRAGVRRAGVLRAVVGLVAAAGLTVVAQPCHGQSGTYQSPSYQAKNRKVYTNKTFYNLPVQIDDRYRANLREVALYVKINNSDWVRQETAAGHIGAFTFRAPQDGEYAFNLVLIDRQGRATPADLSRAEPLLHVVVDTTEPLIDLHPVLGADNEVFLRAIIQDANPDYSTLKIICADSTILEPVAAKPGHFRVPGPEVWHQPIRVIAGDKCGNTTSREFLIKAPGEMMATREMGAMRQPGHAEPPAAQVTHRVTPQMRTDTMPAPHMPAPHMPTPYVPAPMHMAAPTESLTSSSQLVPAPSNGYAPPVSQEPRSHNTVQPVSGQPVSVQPMPGQPVSVQPVSGQPASGQPAAGQPVSGQPASGQPASGQANRQLLSTMRAAVDYRIDQVGPSGVGRVDVYITSDQGNTWQKLCDDPDRRSPAEIQLPGEGVFGLRLVVSNGLGFGGNPPARGDQPTSSIEVDLSSPHVQIREIEPVATGGGHLEIRWSAGDKNLGPEPISLYYRARPDAPWAIIARNVKNDGLYRWTFPRDQGAQFYIRLEATDLAGNVSRADTNTPVMVDMTEPRATVLGITGLQPRQP